jgi:hypothetical protein
MSDEGRTLVGLLNEFALGAVIDIDLVVMGSNGKI